MKKITSCDAETSDMALVILILLSRYTLEFQNENYLATGDKQIILFGTGYHRLTFMHSIICTYRRRLQTVRYRYCLYCVYYH